MHMHRLGCLALLLAAGTAGAASPGFTDLRRVAPVHGDSAAGAQKAAVCFACHGANGTSIAPTFPRLAGQRIDYLYQRLRAFKGARKSDDYYSASPMTAMALPLSDTDMRNLAAFFASQRPEVATPPIPAAAAALETGARLFHEGDSTRGIPPCQGCHGAEARGPAVLTRSNAVYPLLRSQYPPYVVSRLSSFRRGLPHETSSDFIMGNIARTLDDESIQAIAAWLGSLAPEKSL